MNEETGKSRILIVDDTLKNIQVLGTILRTKGYQINIAKSGLQALEVVEKVLPDLILLDVMMPELDGFETCKRLKASDKTRDIPVIFLTAKVETDDIVKGFELGAVDYVTKPFNSVELLKRVESHMALSLLQRYLETGLPKGPKNSTTPMSSCKRSTRNASKPKGSWPRPTAWKPSGSWRQASHTRSTHPCSSSGTTRSSSNRPSKN